MSRSRRATSTISIFSPGSPRKCLPAGVVRERILSICEPVQRRTISRSSAGSPPEWKRVYRRTPVQALSGGCAWRENTHTHTHTQTHTQRTSEDRSFFVARLVFIRYHSLVPPNPPSDVVKHNGCKERVDYHRRLHGEQRSRTFCTHTRTAMAGKLSPGYTWHSV